MGRLSRQVSDQTQIADATTTPATQKNVLDMNGLSGSASTIPEHPSAHASSTLNTPYNNGGDPGHRPSGIPSTGGNQRVGDALEAPPQQKVRLQSLSPLETRKQHTISYDAGPAKSIVAETSGTAVSGASSQPQKTSRIGLFGSAGQPDSLPRTSSSSTVMNGRHATSSPITLHQHTSRDNIIQPATELSRVGAR
jgi:hypothetical protein